MLASIVKCTCEKLVYVSSNSKLCPSCNRPIVMRDGEPYLVEGALIPLLTKLKFFPSHLKYFMAEYPEIGNSLLVIKEDGLAIMPYCWTEEVIKEFEDSLPHPTLLSWLNLS